jgi:hypothetical protein
MPGGCKVTMFVNSDFSDLLRIFNANKVRYLVIGGYALIQYGEPRYTKDLDLWISTTPENASAVYRSLKDFGAPLSNLTEADFSEEGYFYQMGVPPIRVDILMGIPGGDFEQAWKSRKEVDFGGLIVSFISKRDLIKVKRASGRPQDLIDIEHMTADEE